MSRTPERFDLALCPVDRGLTLVEASAGTGKTYSLAAMVLRMLLEEHVSAIGKVLVTTFTNAATAELIDRIRTLVRSAVVAFETGETSDPFLAALVARHGSPGLAIVRAAQRDLDDIQVSTIHGFCARVLEQNALEAGVPFDTEYVENESSILERAAENFWRGTVYAAGPLAARVIADAKLTPRSWTKVYLRARSHPRLRVAPEPLALADAIAGLEAASDPKGPEVAAFTHALRAKFIRDIEPLLEREKRVANAAGYDDLLRRLHARLDGRETGRRLRSALASLFEAVLVDEFQDTDEIQLDIFEGLFADMKLFYVGDPKQAIYAFRGADVFAYIRAKSRADRVYTMETNWRSETPLVAAVDTLYGRCPSPFVLAEIPFVHVAAAGAADKAPLAGDDRKPFEWIWLASDKAKDRGRAAACDAVARECVHLLDASSGARIGTQPVEPRNIAILVRTNYQAIDIQRALLRAEVPAVVSQAGSVFQSDEARELATLLRAVLDPHHSSAVRAALGTRCYGRDAAAIAELVDDESAWQALGETLADLRATWLVHGFAAMASRLLDVTDARSNLLSHAYGQRRLTNLLQLIELAQQAIVELGLSPDGVAAWLDERTGETDGTAGDAAELRLESDDDAVQIVTIHKAKGLEYDITFVPFAWDTTKSKEDAGVLVHDADEVLMHFGKLPEDLARKAEAELESEGARVNYVALTRAKHRCYVVWGTLGSEASYPSALARLIDPTLPASISERAAILKAAGREPIDARTRAALERLCRESGGTMAIRDHDPASSSPHWRKPARDVGELAHRTFPAAAAQQLEPYRLASFSSFAGARTTGSRSVSEGPDYVDPETEPVVVETAPRGIFAFARGAAAGTCLHEIFEKIDFTRVGSDELERLVAEVLARRALDERRAHRGEIDPTRDVSAMIRDVLTTTLPGQSVSLATVTRARKLSEWQFYLSMTAVSPARFADVFAEHRAALASSTYVEALRALDARRVEGFLTGFVDLVFESEGRFGIVDWKSNHLGNDAAAYHDTAIALSMREHHYVLQYHLYVLALHRYLRSRIAGYDYDRHMAGAYYAYLRGIRPGADGRSATGWYHDRPSRALIEALDTLLGGERA